ncbi:MAG TPA: fasciclin domain-containing protein [Luteolibacter sp.]|nr:fasciclin domain-containing protein [Luteolibacter sp.]
MKIQDIKRFALLLSLAAVTPAALAQETKKETVVETTTVTKEQKSVPAPGSLASVIHDGVTFSILAKAVKAAELDGTLSGKGPFTIFAPTDEAFSKLPKGALDKLLLPENKEKLRTLLTYHVVPGQLISSSLKDGDLTTLSGDKLKIDVEGDKVEVDESKIASADVIANNGVFHSIDRVNVPKSLDGFAGLDHDD